MYKMYAIYIKYTQCIQHWSISSPLCFDPEDSSSTVFQPLQQHLLLPFEQNPRGKFSPDRRVEEGILENRSHCPGHCERGEAVLWEQSGKLVLKEKSISTVRANEREEWQSWLGLLHLPPSRGQPAYQHGSVTIFCFSNPPGWLLLSPSQRESSDRQQQ